jgi:signal peptidase I
MQTINHTETSSKSSSLKSCFVVIITVAFGLLGFFYGIGAIWFTMAFIQTQMLNLENILFIALSGLKSILFIFLALRVGKQKWFLSLGLLGLAFVIIEPLQSYLINYSTDRIAMVGNSMKPELESGDLFIVDNLAYRSNLPQRGDIVSYSYPKDLTLEYVKRVIGLPGEKVQIKSGQILINGVLLQEPNFIAQARYSGEWQVGKSEYFILGDNRNSSADSHSSGMVPLNNIFGKVTYRYWPLSKAGKITSEGYTPSE